jgi:hypothetical protein
MKTTRRWNPHEPHHHPTAAGTADDHRGHRLAPPGRRGQAISTYFVACYCGLTIPVVGVGVAAGFFGDFPAVLALSILSAALCTFALASITKAFTPGRAVMSQ